MDTLSHALYGYASLRWRGPKSARWGALFGAAPDVLYWVPSMGERVIKDGVGALWNHPRPGPAVWRNDGPPLPQELIDAYNHYYVFTHSLVILGVVALAWWIVRRHPPWLLLPWALHIVMDIPTHERYRTPFLFPLSDWTVPGYSWSRPPLLFADVAVLLLTYGLLYWHFWRRGRPARPPWPEDIHGVA